MENSQNEDVHGRISRVLDALLEISEAKVVLQNNIANDDRPRVDSLLCSIESCTSALHELIVGRDENASKDSGNTSLTEVSFCDKSVLFIYSCHSVEENPKNYIIINKPCSFK